MNQKRRTGIALGALAMLAFLMLSGGIGPAIRPANAQTDNFGGEAIAMSINSALASTTIADTGPLPSDGGEVEATPVAIQTAVGSADGLLSVTTGLNGLAESNAGLGAVDMLPGTPAETTAYFAMATSRADCSGAWGFSDVTDLTVAGVAVSVTGEPNQVVSIPGVMTLTINEQIYTPDGTGVTVNALDIQTAAGTQAIVGSAFSSNQCFGALGMVGGSIHRTPNWGVSSTPGCIDFTTGGGWVVPPPNKGTFGFVAGYKNGGTNPRGQFEYHDHTSDLNVHSLQVLYYNCGPYDNSRVFGGWAEVNHVSGYCYQVYVQDNGEPGKGTDYFAMWVWAPPSDCPSDGSVPSGTPFYATGNYLGGGNIEIHQ